LIHILKALLGSLTQYDHIHGYGLMDKNYMPEIDWNALFWIYTQDGRVGDLTACINRIDKMQ